MSVTQPAVPSAPLEPQPRLDRRRALRGIGVAGLGAAVAAVSARPAHGEPLPAALAEADVHAVTIAELRQTATAEADHRYWVIDEGREGMFFLDAEDHTTADDNGLVLVSRGGHRFKRVFSGAIHIDWFGARADYDPVARTGTANDDAFAQALAALSRYDQRMVRYGHRNALPPIEFGTGAYLFTRKQFTPTAYPALMGFHLIGQGMYATNIHFDCPEGVNGTDNYFLYNDNRLFAWHMEGLSFWGVTGTERFMYVYSTGTAGKAFHVKCSWENFRIGFDIVAGRANADLVKFEFCRIQMLAADSIFWRSDNTQSVINEFIACDMHTYGTMWKFTKGGILNVFGGSFTTFNDGCLLDVDDPGATGVGVGNGQFLFVGVKPEIRQRSAMVRLNAPEAHVVIEDSQLVIGNSNFAQNWAAGTAYAEGAMVRVGAEHPSMGRAYVATRAHTAADANRPLTGRDADQVWRPTYEIDVRSGSVVINGGTWAYISRLTYGNDDVENATKRPQLLVNDAWLVNPFADSVDIVAEGEISNVGSRPRAIADGCQPYTGGFPTAYWAGPHDPVDVALGAREGFYGHTLPVKRYVFRAFAGNAEGLPAQADGGRELRLPRGANVLRATVVGDATSTAAITVTTHDGAVQLWPVPDNRKYVPDLWYEVGTEAERVIKVSSALATRAEGFVVIEYV
ncbi:hypothetical protein ACQBAU_17315 [Propionibacteriaceae bacterium Y2011]|uniref:hypothetical protein n=1 Tax=Microlunatus sp. Y2014 TaxID=3418488 RepID=UPI003B490951